MPTFTYLHSSKVFITSISLETIEHSILIKCLLDVKTISIQLIFITAYPKYDVILLGNQKKAVYLAVSN